MGDALANVFGYYALQLGADHRSLLVESRIPNRWLAQCGAVQGSDTLEPETQHSPVEAHIVLDPHHLPFQANQLDLLVLPHTLEQSVSPRQVVREAERVLLPEGRLVIAGLNPWNPKVAWHQLKYRRSHPEGRVGGTPASFRPLTVSQQCDWLDLLGFEIEYIQMGGGKNVRPEEVPKAQSPIGSSLSGKRYGKLWGKAYVIVATKKVAGMRLLSAPWQVQKLNKRLAVQKARHSGQSHAQAQTNLTPTIRDKHDEN